jgi:hypothetical protein
LGVLRVANLNALRPSFARGAIANGAAILYQPVALGEIVDQTTNNNKGAF